MRPIRPSSRDGSRDRRWRCSTPAPSTGASRSRSTRRCATRAAPSSAPARSSVPLDVKAVEEALQRMPGQSAAAGRRARSTSSAARSRSSSPQAGRRRSGTRSERRSCRSATAPSTPPADALVVVRTAEPQRGATRAFLVGLYSGLARAGEPAVGTEVPGASPSAFPRFRQGGALHRRLDRHLDRQARARPAPRRGRSRGATASATCEGRRASRRSHPSAAQQ